MSSPAAGKMTWAQALAGPLDGVTCLWQDLDGLHIEPSPAEPPPTSVLWGWREDEYLVRMRLDDGATFVAVHDVAGPGASGPAVLPWGTGDHRVDASQGRGPAAEAGGVGAAYEQFVVDGIGDGTGPITFLRPVRAAGARQPLDGGA